MKQLFALIIAGAAVVACAATVPLSASNFPDPARDQTSASGTQTAVLAGGCFWGVEAVFEQLNGVSDVVSGYAGGSRLTAHYEVVGSGTTGHAESVKITYDPARISYGQLLKVFFAVAHDPTEVNRQGPDEGTQYRSAIFYGNDDQKAVAEAYVKQLNDAKIFKRPIATKISALDGFYPAEGYHQNFLVRNPTYPYIVANDLPKLRALKAEFPTLLKAMAAQKGQ
jgi:peptide-methionine (S)-S-oxide reductase